MEHLCHRCNATVPSGTLFCGQCGAPQIRVATSEPTEEAEADDPTPAISHSPHPTLDANWPDGETQTASGTPTPTRRASTPLIQPRIAWSTALPKAAIAGFFTVMLLLGLLSFFQSAIFVLLVLPLGGIFSIWLYARGQDPGQIMLGTGVRLGAVTGLFTFLIYGIIVAAQFTAQSGMAQETMRKAIEQAMASNPNPQAKALMDQIMTPEGMATLLTVTGVIFLFVFLIFGAIGGSVGAAMIKRQRSGS